jgi:tRNA A-37 threonylcarbamoyl transferase component Bud32
MERHIEVTAGGVYWQIAAEYRDLLLGPDGLRLDEWQSAGMAQVVKHGPHRSVYRVSLPGLDCHIKHYRLMNLRAWLRELVRPAKALVEYRRALAIAGRGVATVEPLAVGRRDAALGAGDSFLITRSLDGTEALNVFLETMFPALPANEPTALRQQLAEELGRFVAQLHRAGVVHHDFHTGNILVAQSAAKTIQLFLIDLHATRLRPPLDWRARQANLVLLNRYFSIRASRTDRLRFWRAYVTEWESERGGEWGSERVREWESDRARAAFFRTAARTLEDETWESNLRFWRLRDGRCRRRNRRYQRLRSTIAQGHAIRELDRSIIELLLADPDAPFRQAGIKVLKDSRSSTVVQWAIPFDGVMRPVIYKRFRATSWTDPLAALVRPTGALRSWINGHGLCERDLPTPRPLAVLHRRQRGLPADGYLLTEEVPDAVDLYRFVASLDCLPVSEARQNLRQCIDRAAALVRELHRRHLSHRDLKASNILVQDSAATGMIALWFIDLVGVRRFRGLPEDRRLQNLARLHVSFCRNPHISRTDKLRFLRTYQQWGLFGKQDWKRWWRKVAELTQAKVTRNLRDGRPLG